MAKKLKGRANPLAELHFIADVPLEQAVILIGNLADDIHVVTLTEVDANNFKFEMNGSSKINGTLQRWQGTETRVSCDGKVSRSGNQNKLLMTAIGIEIIFLIIIASLMVTGQYPQIVVMMLCVAFGFGVYVMAAGGASISQVKALDNLLFRERDRLLQLVIDTFKAAGKIEAYDIEKKQKRLHGDTHREAYRGDTTDDSHRQTAKHNRL